LELWRDTKIKWGYIIFTLEFRWRQSICFPLDLSIFMWEILLTKTWFDKDEKLNRHNMHRTNIRMFSIVINVSKKIEGSWTISRQKIDLVTPSYFQWSFPIDHSHIAKCTVLNSPGTLPVSRDHNKCVCLLCGRALG